MPSDIDSFQAEMAQSQVWARENIERAVATISLELLRRVVMKTPVDTGRARGNWTLTLGVADDFTDLGKFETYSEERKDRGGGATISKGVQELEGEKLTGAKVTIFNNVPYIKALEHGHSRAQAPKGMLALSISEMKREGYF